MSYFCCERLTAGGAVLVIRDASGADVIVEYDDADALMLLFDRVVAHFNIGISEERERVLELALDCIIPDGNPIVAMEKVRQLIREEVCSRPQERTRKEQG